MSRCVSRVVSNFACPASTGRSVLKTHICERREKLGYEIAVGAVDLYHVHARFHRSLGRARKVLDELFNLVHAELAGVDEALAKG